jgi:hypothetical protein
MHKKVSPFIVSEVIMKKKKKKSSISAYILKLFRKYEKIKKVLIYKVFRLKQRV